MTLSLPPIRLSRISMARRSVVRPVILFGLSANTKVLLLPAIRPMFLFGFRSEEHTSELQSLMRISYAVFCLKKKKKYTTNDYRLYTTHNETRDRHIIPNR